MIGFNPTIDYGLLNLTKEWKLVYWKFGELLKTLITLSSSANRQSEINPRKLIFKPKIELLIKKMCKFATLKK